MTAAVVDFDSMSKVELQQWSRDNGLPSSHPKVVFIEHDKSKRRMKTSKKGMKDKTKVDSKTSNPMKVTVWKRHHLTTKRFFQLI